MNVGDVAENTLKKTDSTQNNNDPSSHDIVFSDNKPKPLIFNGDTQNDPITLGSPSRQEVIGNVINEVINDHLNGDHPVPRMVLDDVGDEKSEAAIAHSIPSEKNLDNAEHSYIQAESGENENVSLDRSFEDTDCKDTDISGINKTLNDLVEKTSIYLETDTQGEKTLDTNSLLEGEIDNIGSNSNKVNGTPAFSRESFSNNFVSAKPLESSAGKEINIEVASPQTAPKSSLSQELVEHDKIDAEIASSDHIEQASSSTVFPAVEEAHVETIATDVFSLPETSDESVKDSNTIEPVGLDGGSNANKDVNDSPSMSEVNKEPVIGDLDDGKSKAIIEGGIHEKEETIAKKDEWLDILGNGFLKKKVIKEGLGRESRPVQGDSVLLRCEGKLADGTTVDTHDNLEMVLGDADVIQAIDMCVALMENKETSTLYTDARYAYSVYGRSDYKPPIPPNSHLEYELEILSITRGKNPMEMTTDECILHSEKKRTRGNDLYTRGDFAGAIDVYKRGLKYLEGRREKELLEMKVKCLNNLSAAQLKVKAFTMALQSLDVVLALEPENVKAIFRKGKCLEGLGKEADALECMKKASLLNPENKLIIQDLGRLKSRVAVTQQKEKEIYQRMFQQNTKEVESTELEQEKDDNSILFFIGSAMVAAVGLIAGIMWYKHR